MSRDLILGIESAIGGGSLAIYEAGKELASWTGEARVSRAEEILPNIDRMLNELDRRPKDLGTIVLSQGPGSFTGIRIGIATALGLCESLGSRCVGITTLEALAHHAGNGSFTVGVPMGRDMICIQPYKGGKAVSTPCLITGEQFNDVLLKEDTGQFVVHRFIYQEYADSAGALRMIEGGINIASLLCRALDSAFATEKIHPLFIDRSTFTKSSVSG